VVAKNTKVGFLAFAGMITLMSPCSAAFTTPPISEDPAYCKSLVENTRKGTANSYTAAVVTAVVNYFGGGN
jgi:hypothetical protein